MSSRRPALLKYGHLSWNGPVMSAEQQLVILFEGYAVHALQRGPPETLYLYWRWLDGVKEIPWRYEKCVLLANNNKFANRVSNYRNSYLDILSP